MAGAPKVTFESLFCVFEFFGLSGSVGAPPGHKYTSHIQEWGIQGKEGECGGSMIDQLESLGSNP